MLSTVVPHETSRLKNLKSRAHPSNSLWTWRSNLWRVEPRQDQSDSSFGRELCTQWGICPRGNELVDVKQVSVWVCLLWQHIKPRPVWCNVISKIYFNQTWLLNPHRYSMKTSLGTLILLIEESLLDEEKVDFSGATWRKIWIFG